MGDSDGEDARSTSGLLRDRSFGPFFFGMLVWTMGTWIFVVAAAISMFELAGSTLLVGAVSIAQFGPQFILSPWTGALADRVDRRRQLVTGRFLTSAGMGILTGWIALMGLDGESGVWIIIVSSFVAGVGFAVAGPALQALVPMLVRPSELTSAVALSQMPWTVARAAGPTCGALLLATGGPGLTFGVATACTIAFGVVMACIPIRASSFSKTAKASVWGGIRYIRHDPGIARLLIGVAVVGFGGDPVVTLLPAVAAGYGRGTEFMGVLASAVGFGAVAGFFILGFFRRRFGLAPLSSAGLLLLAIGLVGVAASPGAGYAMVALVVSGLGMTLALTSLSGQLQQRLPESVRGRIMALWLLALLGSRPVAAALNGAVADLLTVSTALIVASAVVVLGAILVYRVRSGPADGAVNAA